MENDPTIGEKVNMADIADALGSPDFVSRMMKIGFITPFQNEGFPDDCIFMASDNSIIVFFSAITRSFETFSSANRRAL